MKKVLSLIICALLSLSVAVAQSMTDKQVVEYIQSAMAQGKSQKQIATELAVRGVSREQAARIQQQYGSQSGSTTGTAAVSKNRLRRATDDQQAVVVFLKKAEDCRTYGTAVP